jgi:hypothetical protein
MRKMKKLTFGLSAATALAAAAGPFPADCSVHTWYQGAPVDVQWC